MCVCVCVREREREREREGATGSSYNLGVVKPPYTFKRFSL